MSAFVNPKNPEKVDIDLDPEGSVIIAGGNDPRAQAHAQAHARAIKEILWGGICLAFLVIAALAFLGGSYSLTHIVDFGSSATRYKGWCAVPYNYGKEVDVEDLLVS